MGLRGAFFINGDISIHALVKRRRDYTGWVYLADLISIHALVKRATTDPTVPAWAKAISIHALVKRATWLRPIYVGLRIFQSTPS